MGKSTVFFMFVGLIYKITFSQSLPFDNNFQDDTYYPQNVDWLTSWVQNFSQSLQPIGSFPTQNYRNYQSLDPYPYDYSSGGYEQPDYNLDWNNQGDSGVNYARNQDYNHHYVPYTDSYFQNDLNEPKVTQAISTILSTPNSPLQVKHKTIISPENPNGSGYVSIKRLGVGQINKEKKDGAVYYRF